MAFCSAGLAMIAGLETCYFFVRQSSIWADSGTGAFDLGRPDSVAGWFAVLITFGTAVLSIFIYSVRRYRLDDYRGRYRVWLGSGVMCLVMSLDGIADLRSLAVSLGVQLSQRVGPGDGVVWWLAPWSLFTAWIGLRMVLDVLAPAVPRPPACCLRLEHSHRHSCCRMCDCHLVKRRSP